MSTEDAALLAAISAAPLEDAPRAVYADVLLGRGDVRGEFILVQLRLAELGGEGPLPEAEMLERDRLLARQTELGEVVGRAAPNVQAFLQRGFAGKVLLGKGGEAELMNEPLFHTVLGEIVVWRSTPESARALTRAIRDGDLPHLYAVTFNGAVGPETAGAIAEWGPFGRLLSLQLIRSEVGVEGLETMLRAPRPRELSRLAVFHDQVAGIGRWLLAACPALVELELKFSDIGTDDLAALVRTKHPTLRSLDVSGNRFGNEGASILATAPALDELAVLDLSACDVQEEGYRALIAGVLPRELRLVLGRAWLAPEEVVALRARFPNVQIEA